MFRTIILNYFRSYRNCLISFITAVLSLTILFSISTSLNVNQDNICSLRVLGSAVSAVEQSQQQSENIQNKQGAEQSSESYLTEYEASVWYLINTLRVGNSLAALQANISLTDISRTRSSDMLSANYFSHYTPDGRNVFNIMREWGVQFSAAGENLAQAIPADIGTPEAFLDAWMKSPTHAANILQAKFGTIGIGMIENGDRRVVTTVFKN
ncbi:MAG: hypothetical protein FJW68_08515 [Actinobacteria bacterium]|nr:hypothetical protein [Actinomycetota bacterium]